MIDYIKMIILALFSGATIALPVSSSAHYSILNSVISFSDDEKVLGFYFSVFSVVFAIVIFVLLRKIYITGFKSLFSKDDKLISYKKLMKNLLISLIPMAVLFIPVGEGMLIADYFDKFLTEGNLLLIAFAGVISALVLVISIWYTRQGYSNTKRASNLKSTVRMSVYQLVSYVIPGVSRVSSAATNMLICDIDSKVIVREIYLYIAPQMFIVNIVKALRYALSDAVVDPVMIIIGSAVTAAMAAIVVMRMSKINIRRLFTFFSIYSAVFGVAVGVLSFIL